jgi:hypothetical protein
MERNNNSMKILIKRNISILFLFLSFIVYAQSPLGFSFQTIIRDAEGKVQKNQAVKLRFSILQGSESGSSVYTETHSKTTNEYGVINLTVGTGTPVSGSFGSIVWGSNIHFLKTEIDPLGGSNYTISSTSQLMSVPYAMYALQADTALNIPDNSPTNELQMLSISNDTIYLTNGGFVKLPSGMIDTDQQSLSTSRVGNQITIEIERGTGITFTDNVDDADNSPTNELQMLSISNDTIYLTDGGFVKLPSGMIDTDQQILSTSRVGNQITIEIERGTGITFTDNVDDADNSPTNELQQLFRRGDTIFISEGNYIVLSGFSEIQGNLFDNSKSIYGGNSADPAFSIQQTNDGGFFISGWTSSTTGDLIRKDESTSIFVLKLRANGTIEWTKSYGGSQSDFGFQSKQTSDGGYVIVGFATSSNGDFPTILNSPENGTNAGILIKINSKGQIEWHRRFFAYINSVEKTSDNNYVVVGTANGVFISKVSRDGEILWQNNVSDPIFQYQNSSYERIIQTKDEGFLTIKRALIYDELFLIEEGYNIIKLTENGSLNWIYGVYSIPGKNTEITSFIELNDRSILIAGTTSDQELLNSSINGGSDVFILKLNSEGTKIWDKTFGGSSDDGGGKLIATADGGYVLASWSSSLDGDLPGSNNGGSDLWIIKFDLDFNIVWNKTYGGPGNDSPIEIIQTDDNGFMILSMGGGNNGAYGQTSSGGDIPNILKGGSDIWLLKLKPNGEKQ